MPPGHAAPELPPDLQCARRDVVCRGAAQVLDRLLQCLAHLLPPGHRVGLPSGDPLVSSRQGAWAACNIAPAYRPASFGTSTASSSIERECNSASPDLGRGLL